MDKTQPQAPEPLNYLTALSSMKAIRRILNDQAVWYSNILWFYVEAPFKVIDFHSFERSLNETGTIDQVIISKLKKIQESAAGNIKVYQGIESRNLEGDEARYYHIEANGDAYPVKSEKGINEFGSRYKIQLYCSMYLFYEFCLQVQDKAVECLTYPFAPKLPMTQEISVQQLNQSQERMVQEEPTNPVKALFFYYLVRYKVIPKPKKQEFTNLAEKYHFLNVSIDVYNIWSKLINKKPSDFPKNIRNVKNLKSVIVLLEPYPRALRAADNELLELQANSK